MARNVKKWHTRVVLVQCAYKANDCPTENKLLIKLKMKQEISGWHTEVSETPAYTSVMHAMCCECCHVSTFIKKNLQQESKNNKIFVFDCETRLCNCSDRIDCDPFTSVVWL